MPDDAAARPPHSKTYSFAELRALTFPPENNIIGHGLLSRNSIMAIAAPPKSFKSFSTNTLLLELLIGGYLFGVTRKHANRTDHLFPINPVKRVLLIEQEIGLQDTQARLVELHDHLLVPGHQALMRDNLFIRSCDYDLRLDRDAGVAKLSSIIAAIRPDVVAFDPLTKFHTSDENSPSEMGRIMLELRQLIHKHDTTGILLHHTGKNEDGKTILDLLRGASAIAADIDTGMVFHVVNRSASMVWVDIDLRRGRPIPPFKLKLNHETLRFEFCGWGKPKGGHQAEASQQNLHLDGERDDEPEQ